MRIVIFWCVFGKIYDHEPLLKCFDQAASILRSEVTQSNTEVAVAKVSAQTVRISVGGTAFELIFLFL